MVDRSTIEGTIECSLCGLVAWETEFDPHRCQTEKTMRLNQDKYENQAEFGYDGLNAMYGTGWD